jgi:hypothetical protein
MRRQQPFDRVENSQDRPLQVVADVITGVGLVAEEDDLVLGRPAGDRRGAPAE